MAQQPRQFKSVDYGDPMVIRILDAAVQCIERFGVRRTSMGEVARVGKISRGSIYRHFADKQALVDGVFTRQRENFLNRTEASLEQQPSLVDKVTLAVMTGRKDSAEGLFARLAETEPETVAMLYLNPDFYSRSIDFWPPHIRLAKESGEISPDVDEALATDLIMRIAVSLAMFPQMGVALNTRAKMRDYLEQIILSGLGRG